MKKKTLEKFIKLNSVNGLYTYEKDRKVLGTYKTLDEALAHKALTATSTAKTLDNAQLQLAEAQLTIRTQLRELTALKSLYNKEELTTLTKLQSQVNLLKDTLAKVATNPNKANLAEALKTLSYF